MSESGSERAVRNAEEGRQRDRAARRKGEREGGSTVVQWRVRWTSLLNPKVQKSMGGGLKAIGVRGLSRQLKGGRRGRIAIFISSVCACCLCVCYDPLLDSLDHCAFRENGGWW